MTARLRNVSNRDRSRRRETEWSEGPGSTGVTNVTASGSAFVGLGVAAAHPGLTQIRLRGLLDLWIRGNPATDGDGYFGAFGIGIVEAPAFAIGITAVPTPVTDAASETWLYHHFFSVHMGDITGGAGQSSMMHQRIVVDSKAMRKTPPNVVMYAVIESVEIGAANMDVFFDSRALLKLS